MLPNAGIKRTYLHFKPCHFRAINLVLLLGVLKSSSKQIFGFCRPLKSQTGQLLAVGTFGVTRRCTGLALDNLAGGSRLYIQGLLALLGTFFQKNA